MTKAPVDIPSHRKSHKQFCFSLTFVVGRLPSLGVSNGSRLLDSHLAVQSISLYRYTLDASATWQVTAITWIFQDRRNRTSFGVGSSFHYIPLVHSPFRPFFSPHLSTLQNQKKRRCGRPCLSPGPSFRWVTAV